jgi:flavin-dependent dehydrogenase
VRDVVVVGGGPVGLAAALHAARAGLDVEVREPRPHPVDKACGEGLMPGAMAALEDLGIRVTGVPLGGIAYLDGDHRAVARFSGRSGRGVRRTALSTALHEAVRAAGIPLVPAAVGELDVRSDRVVVDGSPTRHVIAADGLHSPVRRRLGLDRPVHGPRRFGIRVHVPAAPWSDLVEVHWSAGAEAYVTPVAEDLVGVAVLRAGRGVALRDLPQDLAEFPDLAGRLGAQLPKAAASDPPRGAGPLRQASRRRVHGRVLLVGDASGYVDALTGEGISIGLAQARAAVAAVCAGTPQSYEAAWRRITWRYATLTRGLVLASSRPALRRRLVPAAQAWPGAFERVVDELARSRVPRARTGPG